MNRLQFPKFCFRASSSSNLSTRLGECPKGVEQIRLQLNVANAAHFLNPLNVQERVKPVFSVIRVAEFPHFLNAVEAFLATSSPVSSTVS